MQHPYDVYEDKCPTRAVLNRIADKWSLLVLDCLQHEPMRFNQLRKVIKGVSQKVLSQTLKKLERDGLVSRKAFATASIKKGVKVNFCPVWDWNCILFLLRQSTIRVTSASTKEVTCGLV